MWVAKNKNVNKCADWLKTKFPLDVLERGFECWQAATEDMAKFLLLDKKDGLRWRGIEPRSPAWQARILPLNHQRHERQIVQLNTTRQSSKQLSFTLQ